MEAHELFAAVQGLGKRVVDADVLLKVAFGIQLKRTALDTLREKHRAQVIVVECVCVHACVCLRT